jgi:hypothetical protein
LMPVGPTPDPLLTSSVETLFDHGTARLGAATIREEAALSLPAPSPPYSPGLSALLTRTRDREGMKLPSESLPPEARKWTWTVGRACGRLGQELDGRGRGQPHLAWFGPLSRGGMCRRTMRRTDRSRAGSRGGTAAPVARARQRNRTPTSSLKGLARLHLWGPREHSGGAAYGSGLLRRPRPRLRWDAEGSRRRQ